MKRNLSIREIEAHNTQLTRDFVSGRMDYPTYQERLIRTAFAERHPFTSLLMDNAVTLYQCIIDDAVTFKRFINGKFKALFKRS